MSRPLQFDIVSTSPRSDQALPVIRPYMPADLAAVRDICFQTGNRGDSAAAFHDDPYGFAELFSGYYTRWQPDCAQVIELEGQIVGYLLGSHRTPTAWQQALTNGRAVCRWRAWARTRSRHFLWRAVLDRMRDGALPPAPSGWGSHFHINLLRGARHTGAGATMARAFLANLRRAGAAGAHVHTFVENPGAVGFFERLGFAAHGPPHPAPGFRGNAGERLNVQCMVHSFPSHAG